MAIQIADIRALFARSGNMCAFPECHASLIEADNLFVGQICHIEGVSPGGPRFNDFQSQSERDSVGNLLLLCYPHHRRIDAEAELYTVTALYRMKAEHEARFANTPFKIDTELARAIATETLAYWRGVHAVQDAQSTLF